MNNYTYILIGEYNYCLWTEGKPIPTELRNEEAALRQEIDHEDQNTAGNFSIIIFVGNEE